MLYETNTEKQKKASIPSLQEDNELPWAMYKEMKTREEEEAEKKTKENEIESDQDSVDDNEDKYGNFPFS